MTTLEDLRRRIRSVEGLDSIVRTMKSLAAVQVRHYERAARSLARFDETVELGFQVLLRRLPLEQVVPPRRDLRCVAAIVLGSDQGMCGPFDERIVAFAHRWLNARRQGVKRGPVLAVGHRAAGFLIEARLAPDEVLEVPSSLTAVMRLVEDLIVRIESWRAAERFDHLMVFHNRRVRSASARPRVLQHLPLPARWLRELAGRPWTGPSLPELFLEPAAMLSMLLRQHLFGSLYRAVVASLESENVSRLEAMQAAEDNVGELLEQLREALRHEGQAAVTAELLDIVSGYETARLASVRETELARRRGSAR